MKQGVWVFVLVVCACRKEVRLTETGSIPLASAVAVNDVVETAPPVWTPVYAAINPDVAGFWQGLPARYGYTTKKYPLIVFIHGIGELGTDLWTLNCCGLPQHLHDRTFPADFNMGGQHYSFVVIAPQFKVRPTAAQVQSVIDYALRRWRIDPTRVYVTGLSMGGGSVWDWSAVYGQRAAAIAPICGGTKPTPALAASIASKNVAIWAIYSTKDVLVPAQWGRDFFRWMDTDNPRNDRNTTLTVWTDATHEQTWNRAFDPALRAPYTLYQWLLLHHR